MHKRLVVLQVVLGCVMLRQLRCCTLHPVERNVLLLNLLVYGVILYTHCCRKRAMARVWHGAHVLLALQIAAGPWVFYKTPFLKKVYCGTVFLVWFLMLVRRKCVIEDAIREFDHHVPANLGFQVWHVLVSLPVLGYVVWNKK